MTSTIRIRNVRTPESLDSLPEGTRITFKGKTHAFRYTKRDGLWVENALVVGNAKVSTSIELSEAIDRVTFHGFATVLQ